MFTQVIAAFFKSKEKEEEKHFTHQHGTQKITENTTSATTDDPLTQMRRSRR
jgi:hypothetical protein